MFLRSGTHYDADTKRSGTHWWLYKGTSIVDRDFNQVYVFDHGPGAAFAKSPTV
ncbi:hypothetical protein LCGC14_3124280, partial [marine sediment metagenome]